MAYKVKHTLTGETTIMFDRLEMLRIEKLLKVAGNANDLYRSDENEWLSNALMLFAPELPAGEYPI